MKAKRLFAAVAAVLVMSSAWANVQSNDLVTNDTKNAKGQTVERLICEENGNMLTPYRMCKYSYNEAGQVTEKLTLAWDADEGKWVNFDKTQFNYSSTPLKVSVWKWNEQKNRFDLQK